MRFSFYVCSWIFALSLVYPMIIYELFERFIRVAAQDPMGPSLEIFHKTRHDLLLLLVALQALVVAVVFLMSVFVSHRIAGPLHKLRTYLENARQGDFARALNFRRTDYFHELAHGYNSMMDKFRYVLKRQAASVSAARERVQRAHDALPAGSPERTELAKALEELASLAEEKTTPGT